MKFIVAVLFAVCAACGEGVEEYVKRARVAYADGAYTNSIVMEYPHGGYADRPVTGGVIGWVEVEGMRNVRDIGGWNGLARGRVFRGSEPDCQPREKVGKSYHNLNVTPVGLEVMRNKLCIKTDLDLRGEKECPTPEDSALGVKLVRVPLGAYLDAFKGKELYAKALRVFAEEANYPIYFHCWGGADRTGTVAFLLEGLCGASEADLYIDYELTSFAQIFGARTRAGGSNSENFPAFVRRIKAYPGSSLAEKIANYMREIGLTDDEIARIKKMLK